MPPAYSVLYVDDEPSLLGLAKLFLEKTGEFAIETRESARDGLATLELRHYDAIISDYQMPEMDGIQFLKEVRSRFGDIPFILFTGKGREEVVIEAINSGADFYLQKGGLPKAQFAELIHKIKQAVQKKHAEASLRTSERMISDIISFLPDATFAVDTGGTVVSWNWAMEQMTGVKAAEVIGKGNYEYAIPFFGARRQMLVDMIFATDEQQQKRYYPDIRKEGNVLIAESEDARPKGKATVLWARATPLLDARGNTIGAIESLRDITEFRRLDRTHRREKEISRRAGIRFGYSPGLFDRLVGKSAKTWLRRGVEIYYRDRNLQEAIQCFDRVLELEPENGQAWNGRGVCLKELGRYEEALQCFDRVIGSDDEEVYYNKGETLEKMGEANGDFRLFHEAITCFDRVISMNPGHIHALNYRGVCLKEIGRYDEAKIYFDHAQLLLRRGESMAKPRLTPDRLKRPLRTVPDAGRETGQHPEVTEPEGTLNRPEAVAGIREPGGAPVSERNGSSGGGCGPGAAAPEQPPPQGSSGREVPRLPEAVVRRSQLLSRITRHDISNQLTILQGYLEVLKESQPDPASDGYLEKALATSDRLFAMIRFAREYERIGGDAPVWQDCRALAEAAAGQALAGPVRVQNDIPAGTEICCDPMIMRVFYNLIDNAVRHGGKTTTVRFSLEGRNGDRVIVCEDDGDGIRDGEKEKIFSLDFGKNTGLGLSLSREILSITGMTIAETGSPGSGARFEILVPDGMFRDSGCGNA